MPFPAPFFADGPFLGLGSFDGFGPRGFWLGGPGCGVDGRDDDAGGAPFGALAAGGASCGLPAGGPAVSGRAPTSGAARTRLASPAIPSRVIPFMSLLMPIRGRRVPREPGPGAKCAYAREPMRPPKSDTFCRFGQTEKDGESPAYGPSGHSHGR